MRALRQCGDTIVEVMIVLAVLGLALSISYATANRSLQNTRQAQENAEATQLLKGQIEALRSIACKPSADSSACASDQAELNTEHQQFCMTLSEDGSTYEVTPYDPAETDTTEKSSCSQGSIPYTVYLELSDKPSSTFTGRAEWYGVRGEDKDTVTLTYRLPL